MISLEQRCQDLTLGALCDFLKTHDRYLILTHSAPDGDTLGSAFALRAVLAAIGKQSYVVCPDGVPEKFRFFAKEDAKPDFEPETILSVDIADEQLLGKVKDTYAGRIEVAIDHHVSNTHFAKNLYLDASASATCECIYDILTALGLPLEREICEALYTGISTDTGCFKYSNTTPKTHRIAAELMLRGIDYAEINRIMFDTKTRARIELERAALDAAEFHFGGKCLILPVTLKMRQATGCTAEDVEGISVISRSIEGVKAGVTIKQMDEDLFKISLRTYEPLDASAICQKMGGGGHRAAAGCTLSGTLSEVKETILQFVGQALEETDAGTASV